MLSWRLCRGRWSAVVSGSCTRSATMAPTTSGVTCTVLWSTASDGRDPLDTASNDPVGQVIRSQATRLHVENSEFKPACNMRMKNMCCVIVPRCVEETGRSDGCTWTAVCQSERHPMLSLCYIRPHLSHLSYLSYLIPHAEFPHGHKINFYQFCICVEFNFNMFLIISFIRNIWVPPTQHISYNNCVTQWCSNSHGYLSNNDADDVFNSVLFI